MAHWFEERDALASQYADASNLDARVALHERYSTADLDFRTWQFEAMDLPEDAAVLALGCGPADLWVENADRVSGRSVVVTDVSPGMTEEARDRLDHPDVGVAVADAESIPFTSGAFDAVTAHHVLYHVPDRDAALGEIRRVLRPGGRLYASTNGRANLRELRDAMATVHGHPVTQGTGFRLGNGAEQLREHFEHVEVRRFDDGLRVTDLEPLVAYALSREEFDEGDVPALREAFGRRFEDGVLHVTKELGLFVAERA